MLHGILSIGILLSSKGFYSPIDNATSRNLPLHLNYTIMQRMSLSNLIAELDRIFIGRLKMPNQSPLRLKGIHLMISTSMGENICSKKASFHLSLRIKSLTCQTSDK
ncbi:hypothetical protein PanWU01x14_320090 [Parasponia andersonii]|uniref:Uncharacterized protein n=1 Tax=Parasponia andersonii TaxID=3476 RepID=A0A2P5ALN3_PARAD|nr:hypothetical protein PanWU01x14_320090 [Parasponia andersonii]